MSKGLLEWPLKGVKMDRYTPKYEVIKDGMSIPSRDLGIDDKRDYDGVNMERDDNGLWYKADEVDPIMRDEKHKARMLAKERNEHIQKLEEQNVRLVDRIANLRKALKEMEDEIT